MFTDGMHSIVAFVREAYRLAFASFGHLSFVSFSKAVFPSLNSLDWLWSKQGKWKVQNFRPNLNIL